MPDQKYLYYTGLDDFLQIVKKFVDFSSKKDSFICNLEKLKKKHILNLFAWPGIFAIKMASILGKDQFEKELELIEALLIENNDGIQNIIGIEQDEDLFCYSNDRISLIKTIHIINRLFKDEEHKDILLEKIRDQFKEMYDDFYIDKFIEFADKGDNLDKFVKEKFENCIDLYCDLFERYKKKYGNQIETVIEKYADIIKTRDNVKIPILHEDLVKLSNSLSKDLHTEINGNAERSQLEKNLLNISIEILDQYPSLLCKFAEYIITILNDANEELNFFDSLIKFFNVRTITINEEKIPLSQIIERLPLILFKDYLLLEGKKIDNYRIKNKLKYENTLNQFYLNHSFFNIPKPIRKIKLIFSCFKYIINNNYEELTYLCLNYYIILYLLISFFNNKSKPAYISYGTITRASQLKHDIICFDPAKNARIVRITDPKLEETILHSDIEKYYTYLLQLANSYAMEKINHIRNNKDGPLSLISTNTMPVDEFQISTRKKTPLYFHVVKSKEGDVFGIVSNKSKIKKNIDYKSCASAYKVDTISGLDYNLWIVQKEADSLDERNIGYYFYTDDNDTLNIDAKLLKYLCYITEKISTIAETAVESLENFFNDPIIFATKNLDRYEKWINELTDVYHLYEEFLRSKRLSRAVYTVNAELVYGDKENDKVIERVTKKLRRAQRYHDSPELQTILKEADIEINDILNNAYGPTENKRKDTAKKYWERRNCKHIQIDDINFMFFEAIDKRNDIRNSRTQLFPKIAERNGYIISGNRAFKMLGIPR